MPVAKAHVLRPGRLWLFPAIAFWFLAGCFGIPALLLSFPARVLTQLSKQCLRWAED